MNMIAAARHIGAALAIAAAFALSPAFAQKAPTDAQIALGRQIVIGSGLSRSFGGLISGTIAQINANITRTRPEFKAALDAIQPVLEAEFAPQTGKLIDDCARIFASKLTETEMKDIAAFFGSASGKRYVETQPQTLDEIVVTVEDFRRGISGGLSERLRAEMKKRGHDL